jgi:hypothetical protein
MSCGRHSLYIDRHCGIRWAQYSCEYPSKNVNDEGLFVVVCLRARSPARPRRRERRYDLFDMQTRSRSFRGERGGLCSNGPARLGSAGKREALLIMCSPISSHCYFLTAHAAQSDLGTMVAHGIPSALVCVCDCLLVCVCLVCVFVVCVLCCCVVVARFCFVFLVLRKCVLFVVLLLHFLSSARHCLVAHLSIVVFVDSRRWLKIYPPASECPPPWPSHALRTWSQPPWSLGRGHSGDSVD